MSAKQEFGVTVIEITGDSWERLAKDNLAEAERLQELNETLIKALEYGAQELQIAWQNIELQGDKIRAGHMRIILSKMRAAIAKARS